MNLPIFIPTYKRERIITYENLPNSLRRRVVLVVSEGAAEIPVLRKSCPLAEILETSHQGTAVQVKQFIYDYAAKEANLPVCIMLDDDLKFQAGYFDTDSKKKFRKADPGDLPRVFEALTKKCMEKGTAFSTFSTPFFNDFEEEWKQNKRMAHSFFINLAACRNVGAKFAGISTMSDVKFSLECYTSGLCSWSYTYLAAVDSSKPGDGGESADGKRAERFQQAIDYLTERWPNYVKVRDASKNLRHLTNIGCQNDITFYPSRAYKDAMKKKTPAGLSRPGSKKKRV